MKTYIATATSLDGFIARENGALDWTEIPGQAAEDHGRDIIEAATDAYLIGRGSFETLMDLYGWPYDKPVWVMSRSLTPDDVPRTLRDKVVLTGGSPAEVVGQMRGAGFTRVNIGGAELCRSFLREGLVNEIVISRLPVLIGSGIPLFGSLNGDLPLKHLETRAFASGIVTSTYQLALDTDAGRT
ncbi:MAG: deaminase [Maritimibacter sp.]|nr:deaminase [Maritimibacter sp.]MAQ84375.1 deaminase [Maritimibacter sp.]